MKPRNELPLSAYALYIRSQTLWGGALFMLPFVLLFMRGGVRGWLASTPADSLALMLALPAVGRGVRYCRLHRERFAAVA